MEDLESEVIREIDQTLRVGFLMFLMRFRGDPRYREINDVWHDSAVGLEELDPIRRLAKQHKAVLNYVESNYPDLYGEMLRMEDIDEEAESLYRTLYGDS